MKSLKSSITIFFMLILLLACGSQNKTQATMEQSFAFEGQQATNRRSVNIAQEKLSQSLSLDNTIIIEQKIIKTANIQLEIEDFSQKYSELNTLLNKYSGYISDSREWQDFQKRKLYQYVIRVPQDNFDTLVNEIRSLGLVKNLSIQGEDITREYIDIDARLKTFKQQEQRYLELLNRAELVEDILKIERELNRVRTTIEQLQGQIRFYDNRINLSTINLSINPPIIEDRDGIFYNLFQSIKESFKAFNHSINMIIIFLGTFIPWFIIFSLIFIVIYKFIKFLRKK